MFVLICVASVLCCCESFDPNEVCKKTFQFRKICNFLNFNNDLCRPWREGTCEIIEIKFNYPKCPIYDCSYFLSSSTTSPQSTSTTATTTTPRPYKPKISSTTIPSTTTRTPTLKPTITVPSTTTRTPTLKPTITVASSITPKPLL